MEDEYGRDLCLRYRQTTLRISPISMVCKRVSNRDALDFRQLFESTREAIEELANKAR